MTENQIILYLRQFSTFEKFIVSSLAQIVKTREVAWTEARFDAPSDPDKCLYCIQLLTSALAKPHQACEAYVSLSMTEVRKTVCWFFSFIPLDQRIRRAYSDCPDDVISSDTWSAMEKLLVSVTPRIFRVETLVTPGNALSCVPRLRGFRMIISYDFLQLRLLFAAQDYTCWISTSQLAMFRAGMTRLV